MARPASSLEITPSKLDFGSQAVGVASPPKTATLTNASASPLAIRDISVSGIDFSATNNCPATLSPEAHCAVEVSLKPAVEGPRMGTVIISDSGPASPHFLVVTGTGQ